MLGHLQSSPQFNLELFNTSPLLGRCFIVMADMAVWLNYDVSNWGVDGFMGEQASRRRWSLGPTCRWRRRAQSAHRVIAVGVRFAGVRARRRIPILPPQPESSGKPENAVRRHFRPAATHHAEVVDPTRDFRTGRRHPRRIPVE